MTLSCLTLAGTFSRLPSTSKWHSNAVDGVPWEFRGKKCESDSCCGWDIGDDDEAETKFLTSMEISLLPPWGIRMSSWLGLKSGILGVACGQYATFRTTGLVAVQEVMLTKHTWLLTHQLHDADAQEWQLWCWEQSRDMPFDVTILVWGITDGKVLGRSWSELQNGFRCREVAVLLLFWSQEDWTRTFAICIGGNKKKSVRYLPNCQMTKNRKYVQILDDGIHLLCKEMQHRHICFWSPFEYLPRLGVQHQ